MNKFAIILIGVALVAATTADQSAWNAYKLRYPKHYKDAAEDRARMEIFMKNLKEVNENNERFKDGKSSYEMSLNQFSDRSDDELFPSQNIGSSLESGTKLHTHQVPHAAKIPKYVDWRQKGAVTSVKSQGGCSDCWALTASGALEGAHFIKTGKLTSLSAQNLLDCVKKDEKQCYGATAMEAFEYVKKNGIDTEQSYPYHQKKEQCRSKSNSSGATVKGYIQTQGGNEAALAHAIATVGPVTVAMNGRFFAHYKGGIFYHDKCDSSRLTHAVLAVGYGTSKKHGDYYILKNTFGPKWGVNGYIYLARNRNNLCGVANFAVYPVV